MKKGKHHNTGSKAKDMSIAKSNASAMNAADSPDHRQLSTPSAMLPDPARAIPTPQGGHYWGDESNG